MNDSPTTFHGESADNQAVEWEDHATIHANHDGQGIFDGMKAIHRGTLAQMVAQIAAMPEEERKKFVIQKAGDQKLEADEIMVLAGRSDFPG